MIRIMLPFHLRTLAHVEAEAVIQESERAAVRQAAVEGDDVAESEFDRLGLSWVCSQTNFLLVRIGPAAKQVYTELLKRGVIVRPCTGYDLPEHLRITIGDRSQNERLVSTLEQVLDELTAVRA